MDDPQTNDYDVYDIYDDETQAPAYRKGNRDRQQRHRRSKQVSRHKVGVSAARRERIEARDGTFRCKQCKTIVGIPLSGGRHRNHCPLCLFSRHVDRSVPGDRASECRSMMQPVGLTTRRDGEQMLVHECRGCGTVRHNRIAADDNVVATMRLPILASVESESETDVRHQSA